MHAQLLSHVQLFAILWTIAHPAPLSMGFPRQEYWPVPVKLLSPVRLCDSMDLSLPGSSIHGIFQARVLEWVAIAFSGIILEEINYVFIFSKNINIGLSSYEQVIYGYVTKMLQISTLSFVQQSYKFEKNKQLKIAQAKEGFPGSSAGKESACNAREAWV